MHQIDLAITGVASFVAEPISIDEWATAFKVPDRQQEGKYLDGKMVEKILGIKIQELGARCIQRPAGSGQYY